MASKVRVYGKSQVWTALGIVDAYTKMYPHATVEDLNKALQVIEKYNPQTQIYFSPVFGEIEPKEIVQYLIKNKMYDCKVQVQLHKIIWNPNERGV